MMLPTHALVGLAVTAPVAVVVPELSTPLLAGALVGGIVPDLDVVADHRRTLHYPVGYAAASLPAVVAAVLVTVPATVALAGGLVAAALHCRMDRYGGSREHRPWERRSDRAVYDHVEGRWLRAKRWTRYDGSPEDLLLATVAGGIAIAVLGDPFRSIAAVALVVAVVYTAFRRRIADVLTLLSRRLRGMSDRLRTGCGRQ